MDVRSPFFQNIAAVLAGILFLNPIMVAAADATLTAANGATQVGQANNGVPVVNIATPNGSGLSHNKFTDYNVGQQGLILNNATKNLQSTQLGGVILGNPNLQGRAANLILNEVTGGSPSQLRGYTEVAGQQAHVIVANPNGITCNGCGFINTPRATLTTGKPIIEDGRLDRLQVDGGAISIEGQGLNASNVDQFDLITRSAQINAELQANKLSIITGANDVQVADLAVSARAADPADAPQLAIDSSALGGMYAGAIRLVGTEAGVGVRLAGDLAASAGDIQIDANGQLTLARTAASRDLQLAASDVELTADTYAGREAKVSASGQSQVQQSLAAGQRVQVSGGTLDNQGVVEAGVSANGTLNGAGQLVLDGAKVVNRGELVSHGSVAIDTQTLDNHAGKVRSAGNADIVAAQLDNTQGSVIAQGAMTLTSSALDNQSGELLARNGLSVNAASLDNRSGTLAADSIALELSGSLDNSLGLLESSTALEVNAGSLVNANGKLRALGTAGTSSFVIGGQFNNDSGLLEVGNASLSLVSAGLSNQGGTVRHLGAQDFLIDLDDLGNAGGRFFTNAELSLSAAAWHNTSELQAEGLILTIDQLSQSASGKLISRQSIITSGSDWNNDGAIITDGDLSISLSGDYLGNGSLSTPGALNFQANSAMLGSGADWRAGGQGTLQLVGNLSSQGRLTAAGDLLLQLASLNNQGTLGAGQALRIEADSITNRDGLIFSGTDMALRTAQLSNLYADIYSLGALSILASDEGAALDLLDNRSASIESSGDMSLRATVLNNRKDVFKLGQNQTYGHVSIKCYDCGGDHHNVDYIATERFETFVEEDSAAARIHSGGDLVIQGGAITNQYSTLSAQGDIAITGTSLENTGASAGTIERVRRYNTGRISDGSDERFRDDYINPYNAQPLPKTLPSRFSRWDLVSDIQTETPSGIAAPAIIQAGGDVSISASQPLTNQATLARQAPQNGTEQNPDTTVQQGFTPLVVQLNPQLPADLAQQAVDPLGLPGFTLPQGQNGLFQLNTDPSHRYLVETNPAFASLGGFINSDYMLSQLGYAPDEMQRRLGDGLYEQRLIEQAIAARTGKRFLDGLTSNDAQFRYLMDNAIASKAALNLSVGVALSAEQVAALTHDIVWLEEREVQGQKVLVPVLYLAQAGDRLAPSGALIQGRDVALISGGDLSNSGTLRATANLSVTAGNIGNSGLMQAGERLQLLATDSIRNAQGGIINAKDVSAIAQSGDIRNERTITQEERSGKGYSQLTSVVDNAAAFEAGNSLSLAAGRDLLNIGGTLKAGGNADLSAGGDLVIASAEAENGTMRKDRRHYWNNTSTTQYGSDVQVGGNLSAEADTDLTVVASKIKAGGDIALSAGGDVTIASAANEAGSEYRYKRGSKKRINKENLTVRQQASEVEAGGDLLISADNDLMVSASRLNAGDEAYLYAGHDMDLSAESNRDYSFYEKFEKKKGSFGKSSSKSRLSERDAYTAVGSSLEASDAVLVAGRDLHVKASSIEARTGDVSLLAGNDVLIDHALDSVSTTEARSSSKKSWGGLKSMQQKHKVEESQTQAVGSLVSGDNVSVQASRDVLVTASGVVSTQDINILAGRDLTVDAAANTFKRSEKHKVKGHDLTGILTANNLGLDDITGNQHLSISRQNGSGKAEEVTLTGSTVGSSEGNLTLTAGRQIAVVASDLVAPKDMTLTASDVTIAAGIETARQSSKSSASSLGVGRVMGGTLIDTAQSIYDNAKAAGEADDNRLKAVKTAQALMAAYSTTQQTGDTVSAVSKDKSPSSGGSVIKIGTELAHSRSKSSSEYSSEQVKQSNLNSGGTLSVVASGAEAGSNGNIHIIGSNLKAAETELLAKRDVILESAQNQANWNNQSKNTRTSVGASFNIGEQNGFTLDLGAKAAIGKGKGHDVSQVNSQLDTGSLLLVSGKDTTLAGAQVHADKVQAVIGGDLNIASRQDEAKNKQEQKSAGAGVSICVPPFCYGSTVAASGSLAAGKTSTDYRAVNEQSGIYAGQGGYDISVGDTTRLKGAVIASEASADKNRLSTDRLEHSDIRNRSDIKSQSLSLSASYSSGGETKGGKEIKPGSSLDSGLPLALQESDRSTTRSAVSAGTIEVRNAAGAHDLDGLSRDTAGTNQHLDRPDEKAMQERMDLIQSTAALGKSVVTAISQAKQKDLQEKIEQAEKTNSPEDRAAVEVARQEMAKWDVGGDNRLFADITTGLLAAGLGGASGGTAVGIVANTTAADTYKRIGDYANQKQLEATDEASKAAWAEGGIARVLLHATAGAIQGLAGGSVEGGALGAGASAALMPAIGKALEDSGLSEKDSKAVATLIAAGMGVTIGSVDGSAGAVVGGGTAAGVEQYNRQLHPDEVKFLQDKDRVARYRAYIQEVTGLELTPEEARLALSKYGAALADLQWSKINGRDELTEFFLHTEAVAAGQVYADRDGKQRLLFDVTQAEYEDETINLKALLGQYSSSKEIQQYLKDNYVAEGQETWASRYKIGQQQGLRDASGEYDSFVGGLAGDVWNIAKGIVLSPIGIFQSLSSDEVGPLDSQEMASYYQSLLKLQSRAEEAGRISEYDWATAQRQITAGLPLSELAGAALLKSLSKGAKSAANAERAALPAGYREGSTAGSAFSETAGLPEGFRRVINTKTGNTEVLAADGKLYFETSNGLQPKAGGNLSGLVEAEKNITLRQQASKITAPIDFDGHIIRAEVKSNGNVVGGHSTVTGDVRVIPGTESMPNAQGVYSARIEVADPANPGRYLPKTNNGGVSTMFPKSWTADRIKVEVDAAFQNRAVAGNKWTGTTPSGVRVEGYLSPKTTVYPKL